jgi:hypothetical protein
MKSTEDNAVTLAEQLLRDNALRVADRLWPSSQDYSDLVVAALELKTSAVQRLVNREWPELVQKVLTQVAPAAHVDAEKVWEQSKASFNALLINLPSLSTVWVDPGKGLAQWAVIAVREILEQPLGYAHAHRWGVRQHAEFASAVSGVALDPYFSVSRIKQVLGVTNDDIAKWLGTSKQAVAQWDRGQTNPRPGAARNLAQLGDFANVMWENILPDRIPAMFTLDKVPALGGKTYRQAIESGHDLPFLTDVLRVGVGLSPITVEGWNWITRSELSPDTDPFDANSRSEELGGRAAKGLSRLTSDAAAAARPRG